MRKIFPILLAVALIFAVVLGAFAAAVDPNAEGKKPTRTIENVVQGNQAIRQEFVWDEDSGTWKKVNLYTTGATDDLDFWADRDEIM